MTRTMEFPSYEKEHKDRKWKNDTRRAACFGRDAKGRPVCPAGRSFPFQRH